MGSGQRSLEFESEMCKLASYEDIKPSLPGTTEALWLTVGGMEPRRASKQNEIFKTLSSRLPGKTLLFHTKIVRALNA